MTEQIADDLERLSLAELEELRLAWVQRGYIETFDACIRIAKATGEPFEYPQYLSWENYEWHPAQDKALSVKVSFYTGNFNVVKQRFLQVTLVQVSQGDRLLCTLYKHDGEPHLRNHSVFIPGPWQKIIGDYDQAISEDLARAEEERQQKARDALIRLLRGYGGAYGISREVQAKERKDLPGSAGAAESKSSQLSRDRRRKVRPTQAAHPADS